MPAQLSLLDFFTIFLYIVILLYLGYSSSKKQSSEGFLIADRSLKPVDNAATIVASKIGAGALLSFMALYYLYGISAMWIFVGVSVGYITFIPFAVKLRKDSSQRMFYTYSDYFFFKHGKFVGYVSALIILMVTLFFMLVQLIGGAKILAKLSGFTFSGSLLLVLTTVFLYVLMGGFKAVVKTDKIQLLSILILLTGIGFFMARDSMGTLLVKILSNQGSPPLTSILAFFIMGMLMPFFSAELWQRIYAAKDVKSVRRSLIIAALLNPVVGIMLGIIGVSVSLNLKGIDPDLAMVEGMIYLVPPGLLGLGLVVFFASIMSSADSLLFASVSILLQDFYARIKPVEKEKLVKYFRFALGFFLLLGFVLSIWLQDIVVATYIGVAFGCVMSVTALVSWRYKKAKPSVLVGGIILGFLGTTIRIVTSPARESLIVEAVALTLLGLLLGKVYELLFSNTNSHHSL